MSEQILDILKNVFEIKDISVDGDTFTFYDISLTVNNKLLTVSTCGVTVSNEYKTDFIAENINDVLTLLLDKLSEFKDADFIRYIAIWAIVIACKENYIKNIKESVYSSGGTLDIMEWVNEILDEITDEVGTAENGDYLLAFEGWSDVCFMEADIEPDEYCDYAEKQSDNIIEEWVEKYKEYQLVDAGYAPTGVYGVTWALFKQSKSK